MNYTKKITTILGDDFAKKYTYTFDTIPTQRRVEAYQKKIRKKLNALSENSYHSIGIVNGDIESAILANRRRINGRTQEIYVTDYYFKHLTKNMLANHLANIQKYFGVKHGCVRFYVSKNDASMIDISKKSGLSTEGYKIIGKVDDSLENLNGLSEIKSGITICIVQRNRIKELLELEKKCHPTYYKTLKEIEWLKKQYLNAVKKNDGVLMICQGRVIGSLIWESRDCRKNANISSLSLSKRFRQKGLSKYLYKEAFLQMKENSFTTYTGTSFNPAVIHQSNQLKYGKVEMVLKFNY